MVDRGSFTRNRVAVVQSRQYERKDQLSSDFTTGEVSDLSQIMADTGDIGDVVSYGEV